MGLKQIAALTSVALLSAASASLVTTESAARAEPVSPPAQIVVLTHEGTSPRIHLVREAVAFWNETLSDLGIEPVFAYPELAVAPPALARVLETYARTISQLAGRPPPGAGRPDPPAAVRDFEGDILVLLSTQNLMPFAWPLADARFFIAINAAPSHAPPYSNTPRNVIAHELGHTLGLTHSSDPTALMCLPCQSTVLQQTEPAFLPLEARDRSRLFELYSRTVH